MSLRIEIPQTTLNISSFITPTNGSSSSITESVKKTRCLCCNKKLGLVVFTCRCGGNFCAIHRADSQHDCKFDYKAEGKKLLSTSLEKVVGKKVDVI